MKQNKFFNKKYRYVFGEKKNEGILYEKFRYVFVDVERMNFIRKFRYVFLDIKEEGIL